MQVTDNPSDEGPSAHHIGIQLSLAQWRRALDRAECLCTKMFEMGLPSCCNKPTTEVSPANNQTMTSLKKCCSTKSLKSIQSLAQEATGCQQPCSKVASNPKASCCSLPTAETGCSSTPDPMTCCSSPPKATNTSCDTSGAYRNVGCPSASSNQTAKAYTSQHDSTSHKVPSIRGNQSLSPAVIDIEKGLALEHAIVQISGMTCTGCERKLQRVSSSLPGVHNVKTSLVLGRAEFDVDVGLSINEVALLLERQTGFKCTIQQGGHQLEVLIPKHPSPRAPRLGSTSVAPEKDLASLLQRLAGPEYPSGVENVRIIDSKGQEWKPRSAKQGLGENLYSKMFAPKRDKCRARISYNPHVIGARDLLEKGFGAPLSLAPLSRDHETTADMNHLRQSLYMTLLSAILTVPVLIMAWAPLPPYTIAYGSVSLALATLVQFIIAGPFYPKALKALLFSGMIEMDLLIVISTTTAYIYSVVAFVYELHGQPLSTGEFFETSTLLVTLIMCGRLASAYARHKAADSISIQALQPSTATISKDGIDKLIDAREFQHGDLFRVLPHSVVATDGIVASGDTEIDESMITGESIPVPKSPGSHIIAGSMNGPGPILARLTKLPLENTVSRIAEMVDEAKLSKPRVQETADRVASYFVPCILVITVSIFSIWIAVGIAVRKSSISDAIVTAITYALAALIVSCPCAIGLAVPMVMVIASGVGAKHGVILKSPEAIAKAKNVSHVVFDKTGTLTQGKFVVVEEIYRGKTGDRAASIAEQLTSDSKHPVSQALSKHLESYRKGPRELTSVSSVIGKGMHASLDGQRVQGGNPLYVDAIEDPDVQCFLSQGLTVFCLRLGPELLAIYGLRDALRTDTASVVSALQAQNIPVSIVSGDSITVVNQLATELGIPLSHVKGECTPEEKARYVASLCSAPPGSKSKNSATTTIFCGDGSNDAVALARADIGIHMAGGTDMAKSAADVILTQPSLAGILALIALSRASMRRVYLNFTWSFVYNLFAILLAAGAFVTARIPPAYAGIGELVSVLPVIVVAMHLRWMKFRR